MDDFEVTLVQSRIVDINVNVSIEENSEMQIEAAFGASIHEPIDSADPTVMVKVNCELKDVANKMLHITCVAETIFEINPTPESYVEVLKKHTQEPIQADIMSRISQVLHAMGHNIEIK